MKQLLTMILIDKGRRCICNWVRKCVRRILGLDSNQEKSMSGFLLVLQDGDEQVW